MDTYILLILGTVLATGFAAKQTSTTKPKTFWEELRDDFIHLGRKVAVKAVGGALEIGCRRGCPRLCEDRIGQYFCAFVCVPCTRIKRSAGQSNKGHLTPMPNKFSSYDLNDDGVVSMKELAFVTGPGTTVADVDMVFNMADKNGDKVLSPKELYEGPFVFEMDVSDGDYLYCKYVAKRMSRKQQTIAKKVIQTK